MSYYVIEPEVAGGWGENTQFVREAGKPLTVHRLHYQFDGWLGDHLIESSPCYIVSENLAQDISSSGMTGFALDKVEISKSEIFSEVCGDQELPAFEWLRLHGEPGFDDFGISDDLELVVSKRALDTLRKYGIANATIRPLSI